MGLHLSRIVPLEEVCGVYCMCSWGNFKTKCVCAREQHQSEGSWSAAPSSAIPQSLQRKVSLHGVQVTTGKDGEESLRELACLCLLAFPFSVLLGFRMACHRKPSFLKQSHLSFGEPLSFMGLL